MRKLTHDRWVTAQNAESNYWNKLSIAELLRICAEKPAFLKLVGDQVVATLFENKEMLEIGVGPLGISVASFYAQKYKIKRLVKVEPLERRSIMESPLMREDWASVFLKWIHMLGEEGECVQLSGEQINYNCEFDTVIMYNVLDHVNNPKLILKNAYNALREYGQILVGVDCRSVRGRIKFEYITRRKHKGETIVEAHPYTFLPTDVVHMMSDVGFRNIRTIGLPGLMYRFIGPTMRPAFIGTKIL